MSTYNGMLSDIPDDIVEKLLERQFEQTGYRNPEIFERSIGACAGQGGMDWKATIEGTNFWAKILSVGRRNFTVFYEIYPRDNGEAYIAPERPVVKQKKLIGYKAKNVDYLIAADAVVKNVRIDGYRGIMNFPVHIQICHDIVIDKLKSIGLLNVLFTEVYGYV